jgi:hypothetical protein
MAAQPIDPDQYDRVAKLLVDAGDVASFPEARALLGTYRLQIYADAAACQSEAWQAAMATAVNTGVRAMHGGVLVTLDDDAAWLPPNGHTGSLSQILAGLGAIIVHQLKPGLPTIAFSSAPPPGRDDPVIYPVAGQWLVGVSPSPAPERAASTLAAVMAGAIAVSECFQQLRGFPLAGDRHAVISLWDPEAGMARSDAEGPPITHLPAEAWILGLGHLGQAYAWLLSLLPYAPHDRHLILHDDDRLSTANRATSLLEHTGAIGTRKPRVVAAAMEAAGWDTALVEQRYRGGPLYAPGEPALLLAGVDNRDARRALDETGFPTIYDAGLGAGPDGYLDMALRRLPASRPSTALWSEGPVPDRAGALLDLPAYQQLEHDTGDRCGVELLAGRTVATSFVGATAACWIIGSVLREIHGGRPYELIDYSLRQPGRVSAIQAAAGRRPRISTAPVRAAGD